MRAESCSTPDTGATEDHGQRRVVVVEADTDPGDMGEPREFEADGVVYITVPPPEGWS